MDEQSIGIKMADGSFYPVLDANFKGQKRIILTTVRDNQSTVQIDLYKGEGENTNDYVGSLVIENINPAQQKEPEIEVIIGFDKEGNLNAVASDKQTGNKQRLITSLESLKKDEIYEIPDFELEENHPSHATVITEEEGDEDEGEIGTDQAKNPPVPEKKPSALRRLLFVLGALLLIALITLAVFYFTGYYGKSPARPDKSPSSSQTAPATEKAPPKETQTQTAEVKPVKPAEPVSETKAAETKPSAPAVQEPTTKEKAAQQPAVTPATKTETAPAQDKGTWYRIKWGDTLWDIANSYYRNPLMYKVIAAHPKNHIKNPDFIMAGYMLFIPEK